MTSPFTIDPIKHILFATDFSEASTNAMCWATELAKKHSARLSVLHVAHAASMASLPLSMQGEIDRSLSTLEALIRDRGAEASVRWEVGRPWEVINAEAEEYDLVVIGARGRGEFVPFAIGSTADRVLRASPVPVLLVHGESRETLQLPKTILVPTDFSGSADSALQAAARVFGTQDAEIVLLHAWQPLVNYGEPYVVLPPATTYMGTEEHARESLDRLSKRLSASGLNTRAVLRPGYPVKVIVEEARELNIDVIAMGTHGHSGLARFLLGSVAERVMHQVSCAVLTVSDQAVRKVTQESDGAECIGST